MYNTELCSNYNGSNRGLVVSIHDLHAAGHGFTRFARSEAWVYTICTQRVMGSHDLHARVMGSHDLHTAGHGFTRFARSESWVRIP